MGCTGKNQSLAVSWTGAPEKTQSFVLIMHDPDAPTGVGFFHWLVVNLPKETNSLAVGASASLPPGTAQTTTDFGMPGYGGPCPPPGPAHRYSVTVYALDVPKLDVPPTASGALLRFMLRDHTLALGRAVATYQRP
jgi:Raf kinase inhibitor-like YbhB/YbcL family protein